MSEDLFCESPLTIQCILGNKIEAISLANTCAKEYGFIDKKLADEVCQILEIGPQHLIKPKHIYGFDGGTAKPITHAIYLILTVDTHTESLAPLVIKKLRHHPMVFAGYCWKNVGLLLIWQVTL